MKIKTEVEAVKCDGCSYVEEPNLYPTIKRCVKCERDYCYACYSEFISDCACLVGDKQVLCDTCVKADEELFAPLSKYNKAVEEKEELVDKEERKLDEQRGDIQDYFYKHYIKES